MSGDKVYLNSVDHSLQVYKLKANGNYELPKDETGMLSGEVALAWKFEVSLDKRSIITSLLSLREFDAESLKPSNSEVTLENPRFLHSLALVS